MFFGYSIYMLPDGHDKQFLGTRLLKSLNGKDPTIASEKEYELTYMSTIDIPLSPNDLEEDDCIYFVLDKIYECLNLYHPKDYKCHSLSCSDVVYLMHTKKYYFCDDLGWKELDWK